MLWRAAPGCTRTVLGSQFAQDDLTEDAPQPVGLPVGAADDEAEVNAEEDAAEGQDTALEQRATAKADAQTLSLQLQRGHLAGERRRAVACGGVRFPHTLV